MSSAGLGDSPRTKLKRIPERAVFDKDQAYQLLDSQFVAHVGVSDGEQPFVLPMAYARDGDRLLLHGSRASRLMKLLAAGQPCCVTVTALDAIVVARSGYESSMNYRSLMVLGTAREVAAEETTLAINAVIDGLIPGRSSEVREPTAKELAASMFLELPLTEMSMKVRTGVAEEPTEDHSLPIWGGVLPITQSYEVPEPDEWAIELGLQVPASIKGMCS